MKNFIVIDTETAPTVKMPKPCPELSRVYDMGYIIANNHEVIEKRSFIISDTFFDDSLMNSAYYASKKPIYQNGMNKEWKVASFLTAYKQFMQDVETYKIKEVWAYNVKFDVEALNATIKSYSNGFNEKFFPENIAIRDIWTAAGRTVCNTKKYCKWCRERGKVSPKGNPSTTAETVYQYITKNDDFAERHTALQDSEIELQILRTIKTYHKKMPKNIGRGWYYPAQKNKTFQKKWDSLPLFYA